MANEENLTSWPKGISGNPKGRPKKIATLMKEQGYKIGEINDTLQALLACTVKQLDDIIDHKDATVLELMVAKTISKSMKDGNINSLESILSRVFGHPKQSFEATISEQPLLPDMDEEEKEEEF